MVMSTDPEKDNSAVIDTILKQPLNKISIQRSCSTVVTDRQKNGTDDSETDGDDDGENSKRVKKGNTAQNKTWIRDTFSNRLQELKTDLEEADIKNKKLETKLSDQELRRQGAEDQYK
eukprot:Pgem_evm1s10772